MTYIILTLLVVFMSNAKADPNYLQVSLIDGVCFHIVENSASRSNVIAHTHTLTDPSLCESYGDYSLLKDEQDNGFVLSLSYFNPSSKIETVSNLSLNHSAQIIYNEDVIWVFDPKDNKKTNPVALMYSSYVEELVDSVNNIWEPKESYNIVSLNGLNSCLVAKLTESESNYSSTHLFSNALEMAKNSLSLKCLN